MAPLYRFLLFKLKMYLFRDESFSQERKATGRFECEGTLILIGHI